jgi:hypothetical protein
MTEPTADKQCGNCNYFTLPMPGGTQKAPYCSHGSNKRVGSLGCDPDRRWEHDAMSCHVLGVDPDDKPCSHWAAEGPRHATANQSFIAMMLATFGHKPPTDEERCPLCDRKKAGRRKKVVASTVAPPVVPGTVVIKAAAEDAAE